MRKKQQRSNPTLPAEIIEEILLRLPVKSLMRFRCVSKRWRSLFIDPAFITMHLNRSAEKKPTHVLVLNRYDLYTSEIESGTQTRELHLLSPEWPCMTDGIEALCDGLVCLSFGKNVGLYNPATREFLLLREEKEEEEEDSCYYQNRCFGLGFDPMTRKYKLVRITEIDDSQTSVDIYTLGSHRWRGVCHSLPFTICYRPNASVTVSGAVHWVAFTKIGSISRLESTLSFDFQREVFQEVPLPEFGLRNINFLCIGVLGGCLSVSANFGEYTEIWVMRVYGVKESWTKLFSMSSMGINGYRCCHIVPLGFWKDGEILLQKDRSELTLYNPESKTEMKLGFCGGRFNEDCQPFLFNCASLVESLICLRVESGRTNKKLKVV